jgi:hypothetical protein
MGEFIKTRRRPLRPANQLTAEDLVRRLLAVRRLIQEVDGRGGVVKLLDDAQAAPKVRHALGLSLAKSWVGLRGYVVRLGDERRRRGEAVPAGWLPGEPYRLGAK